MQTQNNLSKHKTHQTSPLIDNTLIEQLYDAGVIQFGKFKLKSGIIAPIYLDLRRVISYPDIMKNIAYQIGNIVNACSTNSVCGVPYAGIPLATSVALLCNKSMIMPRKEIKEYGTKRKVEGIYKNGDTTIIIEDIMTTGSSIKETYEILVSEGIKVKDIIVFCDRRTAQQKNKTPYNIHALYTINEIVDYLHAKGKINDSTYQSVQEFLAQ